jgi:hypothetical protein
MIDLINFVKGNGKNGGCNLLQPVPSNAMAFWGISCVTIGGV